MRCKRGASLDQERWGSMLPKYACVRVRVRVRVRVSASARARVCVYGLGGLDKWMPLVYAARRLQFYAARQGEQGL